MIDYAAIAEETLAAIQEAGAVGVLARFVKTFAPVTGAISAVTCTKGNIDCVSLALRKGDATSERLVEALVKGKAKKFLIAASGAPFAPVPLDVISFDGQYWEIVSASAVAPTGAASAIIYTALTEKTNLDTATIAALVA